MGTYRLGRRFAIGGMAEVYLASTVGVGGFSKPVAVKRVLPHMAEDATFVEHFMQEARLTESLQHRNIVQVLDLGTQAGEPYMILELVDGENLRTLLKACARSGQRIELREAVCIAMQVAEGLAHAHESTAPDGRPLGLVHRDINPANVLLSVNGEVKLADFGIARAAEMKSDTQAGVVKGKPGYLSPEQVRGKPAGQASDVFLLGLLLHELITGRALFHGLPFFQAVARIRGFHPSQLERPEGLPEALWTLLRHALAPRPEERLGSARAFAEALEDFLFTERLRVGARDLAALLARVFPQRVSILRDMGLKQGRVLALDPWSVALAPGGTGVRDEALAIAAADAVLEAQDPIDADALDPESSDEVDQVFEVDDAGAPEVLEQESSAVAAPQVEVDGPSDARGALASCAPPEPRAASEIGPAPSAVEEAEAGLPDAACAEASTSALADGPDAEGDDPLFAHAGDASEGEVALSDADDGHASSTPARNGTGDAAPHGLVEGSGSSGITAPEGAFPEHASVASVAAPAQGLRATDHGSSGIGSVPAPSAEASRTSSSCSDASAPDATSSGVPRTGDGGDVATCAAASKVSEPEGWDVSIFFEGVEATAFRTLPPRDVEGSGAQIALAPDALDGSPPGIEVGDEAWPKPPPTHESTAFLEADEFELIDESPADDAFDLGAFEDGAEPRGAHADLAEGQAPLRAVDDPPTAFEFDPEELDDALSAFTSLAREVDDVASVGAGLRLEADSPRPELLPELPEAPADERILAPATASLQTAAAAPGEAWQQLLGAALMAVSPNLGEQGPQVATLAVRIAVGLGLPAPQVGEVRLAALTLALGTGLDATHGTPTLHQLKALLGQHWGEASHALEGCGLFGAEIAQQGPGLALAAALEVSRTGGTPIESSNPQATLDAIRREGRLPACALPALAAVLSASPVG